MATSGGATYDKYGKLTSGHAPGEEYGGNAGATTGGGFGGTALPPATAASGYGVGAQPNFNPGSTAATGAAQQAVMGLQSAGPNAGGHWGAGAGGGANTWIPDTAPAGTMTGGGGEGSFYDINEKGQTSSHVTPNQLPLQAQLQQSQTQLEGQLATGARTQAGGIAGDAAAKQNDYAMQQEAQRAKLAQDAFNARWASMNGGGSNGAILPREQMGPGGGMNDLESQARAGALSRAKEQAAGTAGAARQGLMNAMDDRGMTGSSLEAQGMGNIIGGAANSVNDFTRESYIQDLNRYSGIADETYQGNIAQRGQDVTRQNAIDAARQSAMSGLFSSVRY